jgi:RNA polymerase sigma-70 factor (ECF subfamily)
VRRDSAHRPKKPLSPERILAAAQNGSVRHRHHQGADAPRSPGNEASRSLEDSAQQDRFAAIVDRFQLLVFAFLRARLLQESDAEDLTQEVFLRFYGAGDRFDDSREIRPYLLGIARNLLRERARTLRHRGEVSWTELCLEVEEHDEPDDDLQEELLHRLPHCVAKLGPAARMAIELHYGARLKVQEIAQRMQRSEGAVKVLLFRARQALKRCLAGQKDNAAHE